MYCFNLCLNNCGMNFSVANIITNLHVLFVFHLEFLQQTEVIKGIRQNQSSLYMLESFPRWFVMNRPVCCRSVVLVSVAGFMKLNYSKTL